VQQALHLFQTVLETLDITDVIVQCLTKAEQATAAYPLGGPRFYSNLLAGIDELIVLLHTFAAST
jgi:hypothetical protein